MRRRNIVLVTWDSVRADHCSFMGYHRNTTPTLDRLARRGLCFGNSIAAGIGTPASMMGAFTGNFAPLTDKVCPRMWKKEFAKRKTLAQLLLEYGYSTGAIVPNTFASSYFGFNKGFQFFQDFLNNGSRFYKLIFENAFVKSNSFFFVIRNLANFILRREVFTPWDKIYDTIIDWVKSVRQPFFLWVLLMDTHFPYLAPRTFRTWSNLVDMYYSNWKLQSVNFENKLSKKDREKLINIYDDSIRYADSFVEKLIKDLEEYDPIYIIHSDHGEGFGEHGYYMHGFVRNKSVCLYEELIHIPMIIYNADISGRIDRPVSLLSLPSTVSEIVGISSEFPSKSFKNDNPWVVIKAVEDGKIKVAVRTKDWKYIIDQKNGIPELYCLTKDPCEQNNIIDEHPELAKALGKIAWNSVKEDISRFVIKKTLSKLKV